VRGSRWIKIVAGIAVVFLLVGMLLPYLLNVDRYRASISTLISQQNGRQVTLGMIRARFLPQVGFDVAGFHMNNPQGFVAGEFLAAEHVRGTLAFWPLVLHRQLRLTSLELIRPKLILLQNSRGENNYTFPPPSSGRAVQRQSAPQKYVQAGFVADLPQQLDDDAPPPNSVLQVDELILRDAEVVYGSVDAAGRGTAIVDAQGFDATLRHMQLQPLVIRAWQADGSLSGARVTLADWNGPIAFHGGSVTLQNGDLESKFTVDFGKAARVDGSVSVPDVTHAVVKFDLDSADVNVDALEANARIHKAAANLPSSAAATNVALHSGAEGDNRAPTAAGTTSELLAQGHLDAKKVRWGAYAAGPASADLRFYSDRVEMWPITVRFAGGSLQASARTDSRQTPQRFSVNLEARNLSVEQMLEKTPSLRGKFAGTGELDLQVFGSLDAAWLRSLAGKGEFAVRNGRISGFNLSGVAQSVANLAGVKGNTNTTFTAITGDLDMGQERITSRDIHLDSSLGTLDLKGSCGLDSALDYDGQVALGSGAATPQKSGGNSLADVLGRALAKSGVKITVPFTLRGTLQHPEILPGRGGIAFPAPAASHSTGTGLSYPNLFQQSAPAPTSNSNSQ
jgi:uncharacterized protein involved in outer membrane biogenesis